MSIRDFQNGKNYPVFILRNTAYPINSVSPPLPSNAGWNLMICLKTNSITMAINGIDASTKCSQGWADSIPGDGSWSIKADGAVVPIPNAGEYSVNDFFDIATNKEAVWVAIFNPDYSTYRVGVAYFSQLDETFDNNVIYTFTTTLTGKGKIHRSATT
jgi:predicted secreted protein